MKSRLLILLSVLLCLISTTALAYYGVPYWYSDRNEVAMWLTYPSFSRTALNGDGQFNAQFMDAILYARNQWQPATTNINYAVGTANIPCYGGTGTEISNAIGSVVEDNYLGVTFGGQASYSYVSYNGNIKGLLKQLTPQKVCVVKQNGQSLSYYRRIAMHELGHAMGWLGHASGVNDIMGNGQNGILSDHDKQHLNQVYSLWN